MNAQDKPGAVATFDLGADFFLTTFDNGTACVANPTTNESIELPLESVARLRVIFAPARTQFKLSGVYQDGAEFYRTEEDAPFTGLVASYPHLCWQDSDLDGADKARRAFALQFPQYVVAPYGTAEAEEA